jgi:outer membrane protein assembly factor BamB
MVISVSGLKLNSSSMKYMTNLLLIVLASVAFCCSKEPVSPVSSPIVYVRDSVMQLLWAIPSTEGSYKPILFENQVGFQNFSGSDLSFVFRDTSDGQILWRWGGDVPDLKEGVPSHGHFQFGSKFCFSSSWDNVVVVDLETRRTDWFSSTKPLGCGEPRIKLLTNNIYHAHHTGSWATSFVRSNVSTSSWDTLYNLVDGNWETSIISPSMFVDAQGDSIVIFIETSVNWGTSRVRSTMTALDLNSRDVKWRNLDFEPDMNCNTQYMEVLSGKVYKLGSSTVWCFDADTGTLIWKKDFDPQKQGFEHFMGNNQAFIHKEWILAKGADKHMEALDLNTGKVIWQTDEGLSSHYSLHVYKDKYIIYAREGGGGIAVHRLDNGRLIYKNNKIAWGAISGGDLAIDHAADRIYWTDGKYAYCFRLNLP